ncbi:DNA repair protein RadA [soil metagenome]
MARSRVVWRCTGCGTGAPQWAGRCPGCGEWNTLVEEVEAVGPVPVTAATTAADRPVPIAEVATAEWLARPTGIAELDRVLGGGLVPGSVTLVGGEPGIGKSTLLLQMVAAQAAAGARALYVSAEESTHQVRLRAERLGALGDGLWLAAGTVLGDLVAHLDAVKPDVVVVDSIQTVYDPEVGSAPGTVSQVRHCAHRLVGEAKARGVATVLVGHVTKDGSLAGPRVLEHVVDTVLAFEGDRHHALRLLRAVKHRFGPTEELGLFEMSDAGMIGVPDPSGLFLADRRRGAPGSVVMPAMEGHRPLLVECQALVVRTKFPSPRRSAQGLDGGRLDLLLAVLQQRVGIALNEHDVYVSAVGGVRISEPGADLAVSLAVASEVSGVPVPADVVACGEVALAGELRQVGQTGRRLAEAARLGFARAVLPASAPDPPAGIKVLRVGTLAEAVARLGLGR